MNQFSIFYPIQVFKVSYRLPHVSCLLHKQIKSSNNSGSCCRAQSRRDQLQKRRVRPYSPIWKMTAGFDVGGDIRVPALGLWATPILLDSSRELTKRRMASSKGMAIVVMGVSGAGKSTVGSMLAEVMNGCFLDADDYHPQANKDKMKAGIPLSDEDRIPWLETLRDRLRVSLVNGGTMILGCSALQKHYREILRCADPGYILGSYRGAVKFVLLSVGPEVLAARLERRAAEGRHFMPAKLLQSQLDLLQIDESEGILTVDASLDPQQTLKMVQALVMP